MIWETLTNRFVVSIGSQYFRSNHLGYYYRYLYYDYPLFINRYAIAGL